MVGAHDNLGAAQADDSLVSAEVAGVGWQDAEPSVAHDHVPFGKGGIYNADLIYLLLYLHALVCRDSVFERNAAKNGAITSAATSEFHFHSCVFQGNTAEVGGGVINIAGAAPTVSPVASSACQTHFVHC